MVAEMKRFELLRRGTPDLPHFECGPFNHLGTSPYISVCFILKKFLERKAGENTEKYSIFDFENPFISRISGGRNDQAAVKFRVSPVMTTSIPLRICSSSKVRETIVIKFFRKSVRYDGQKNHQPSKSPIKSSFSGGFRWYNYSNAHMISDVIVSFGKCYAK